MYIQNTHKIFTFVYLKITTFYIMLCKAVICKEDNFKLVDTLYISFWKQLISTTCVINKNYFKSIKVKTIHIKQLFLKLFTFILMLISNKYFVKPLSATRPV